jgi:hypothetical protein
MIDFAPTPLPLDASWRQKNTFWRSTDSHAVAPRSRYPNGLLGRPIHKSWHSRDNRVLAPRLRYPNGLLWRLESKCWHPMDTRVGVPTPIFRNVHVRRLLDKSRHPNRTRVLVPRSAHPNGLLGPPKCKSVHPNRTRVLAPTSTYPNGHCPRHQHTYRHPMDTRVHAPIATYSNAPARPQWHKYGEAMTTRRRRDRATTPKCVNGHSRRQNSKSRHHDGTDNHSHGPIANSPNDRVPPPGCTCSRTRDTRGRTPTSKHANGRFGQRQCTPPCSNCTRVDVPTARSSTDHGRPMLHTSPPTSRIHPVRVNHVVRPMARCTVPPCHRAIQVVFGVFLVAVVVAVGVVVLVPRPTGVPCRPPVRLVAPRSAGSGHGPLHNCAETADRPPP